MQVLISPAKGDFREVVSGHYVASTIRHNSVVFTRTVLEDNLHAKCYYSVNRSRWHIDIYEAGVGWKTVYHSSTVSNNTTSLIFPIDLASWFAIAKASRWEEDGRMKVSVLLDEEEMQSAPEPRQVTLLNTCASHGTVPVDSALQLLIQASRSEIFEDTDSLKSRVIDHLAWAVGQPTSKFACGSILPSQDLESSAVFSIGLQIHHGHSIRSQLVSQLLKRDSPAFSLPLLQERLVGVLVCDHIPPSEPTCLRLEQDWLLRWTRPAADGCAEIASYLISGRLHGKHEQTPLARTQVEAWLVPEGIRTKLVTISVISVNEAKCQSGSGELML
jgi:hypothetical protein